MDDNYNFGDNFGMRSTKDQPTQKKKIANKTQEKKTPQRDYTPRRNIKRKTLVNGKTT